MATTNKLSCYVSVIIPTYNGEKYLPDAIESILNQSFQNFELIIIDDVSHDGTWKIINEYALRDSRIRPFRNETNLGFAGNRNKAISLAQHEFIVWQDQDDVSYLTRIQRQLDLMLSDGAIGIVGSYMELFDDKLSHGIREYPKDDSDIRKMIFRFSPIALPASMLRKEAILKVNKYDTQFAPAADLDMSFKIGTYYKLANIPEVLIRYRVHQNSATYKNLKRIELDTIKIRIKYANSTHFKPTFFDYLFNFLHFISIWTVPPRLKILLFNLLRTGIIEK